VTAYVFTGPTLSAQEARGELEAVYLPPAAQGDVYRIACKRPRAIGIIDGYFERVPAVWHKEILWAMKEGIHVFGSASMGALRAAELAPFGMEGVGKIFQAFSDGILEDDDEVAVVHAPQEQGYRPSSVAMVDIRATLASAERQRALSSKTRKCLEQVAKSLFYPDRRYDQILARARSLGLSVQEIEALESWLPEGEVHQKREDALEMLRLMRQRLARDSGGKEVHYCFEHTFAWDECIRSARRGQQRNPRTACHQTEQPTQIDPELGRRKFSSRRIQASPG